MKVTLLTFLIAFIYSFSTVAEELVIGIERIEPGIIFIFEGAIKDTIYPSSLHLTEKSSQIHIEARVNWDSKNIPKGAVKGGFIPYLHITSKIVNETNGLISFIDLFPHINLIDNFHYARNIYLPGAITDTYTVTFDIHPPQYLDLSFHNDWVLNYGDKLLEKSSFSYSNINLEKIAKLSR